MKDLDYVDKNVAIAAVICLGLLVLGFLLLNNRIESMDEVIAPQRPQASAVEDVQQAGVLVVPYIPLPAAKDPNTGIELSAQQNPYQFRCWILPAGTKIIYPDGTEKILFEKGFLTMAKRRGKIAVR